MSYDTERLYHLLPAYYRMQDEKNGGALKALIAALASQARAMELDIETLYENWFIETCAEWVVPYIGDLVGNRPLHPVVHTRRADVAKTIYYRRRKSTLPMLEELARDVTGWGVHAVEFFELLNWTQHLNHLRLRPTPNVKLDPFACDAVGTPNLRNLDALDRINHPFEGTSHTVDVRKCANTEGWYNIRNIGFFLYRLEAFPLERAELCRVGAPNAHCFHIHPLGNDAPLFNHPQREDDSVATASEIHVPAPIRPLAFVNHIEDFYGPEQIPDLSDNDVFASAAQLRRAKRRVRRLQLYQNGIAIPASKLICKNLKAWKEPPAKKIAIDVTSGRIMFPTGEPPLDTDQFTCNFSYGFSAPIGGGPYDRRGKLQKLEPATTVYRVKRDPAVFSSDPATHADLISALNAMQAHIAATPAPHNVFIQILDSRTYDLLESINLPADGTITIEAANNHRPCLVTKDDVLKLTGGGGRKSAVRLNGLLIAGSLHVTGDLGGLQLVHSTLVPGRALLEDGKPSSTLPSLIIENGVADALINADLQLDIIKCITGPLRVPNECESLRIEDSIVDGIGTPAIKAEGNNPGPPSTIDRSTVFGLTRVQSLDADASIFTDQVLTQNTQRGCVRFCFILPGSRVSRRYRCQPDLVADAAVNAALLHDPALSANQKQMIRDNAVVDYRPTFTTTRYGQLAYAQLRIDVPCGIRKGAENGSEMGAFSILLQPQREANLRLRLEEYLPLTLDAGLILVT